MSFAVSWDGPVQPTQVTIQIEAVWSSMGEQECPTAQFEVYGKGGTQFIRSDDFFPPIAATIDEYVVSIFPEANCWSSFEVISPTTRSVKISCEPLDVNSPGAIWWPSALGVAFSDQSGHGIKIGVIDADICRDCAALLSVKHLGHATLPSVPIADDTHGSLVMSFMAGSSEFCRVPGLAPAAEFFFISASDLAGKLSEVAVADAIEILSEEHSCDLIVISAGDCPAPQPLILGAVNRAKNAGTICFFAAGNEPGKLSYPAKYPDVLAIGALGKHGTLPKNSRMHLTLENDESSCFSDQEGNLFLSGLLSLGFGIDMVVPGIGVIGDFGNGDLFPVCGTSFAAPVAAGYAAVVLSGDKEYTGKVGHERFSYAKRRLDERLKQGRYINGDVEALLPHLVRDD